MFIMKKTVTFWKTLFISMSFLYLKIALLKYPHISSFFVYIQLLVVEGINVSLHLGFCTRIFFKSSFALLGDFWGPLMGLVPYFRTTGLGSLIENSMSFTFDLNGSELYLICYNEHIVAYVNNNRTSHLNFLLMILEVLLWYRFHLLHFDKLLRHSSKVIIVILWHLSVCGLFPISVHFSKLIGGLVEQAFYKGLQK